MNEPERTFYLVRHAQSLGNAGDPTAGYDSALSDLGRLQAQAVARALRESGPLDRVWTSPFGRAVATACAIAEPHECGVELHAELHEYFAPGWMDPSTVEFEPLDEIAARHELLSVAKECTVDRTRWWSQRIESVEALTLRLVVVARRLLSSAPRRTVCVGHGASVVGLFRALVSDAEIPAVNNASIFEVRCAGGEAIAIRINDTAHLPEVT